LDQGWRTTNAPAPGLTLADREREATPFTPRTPCLRRTRPPRTRSLERAILCPIIFWRIVSSPKRFRAAATDLCSLFAAENQPRFSESSSLQRAHGRKGVLQAGLSMQRAGQAGRFRKTGWFSPRRASEKESVAASETLGEARRSAIQKFYRTQNGPFEGAGRRRPVRRRQGVRGRERCAIDARLSQRAGRDQGVGAFSSITGIKEGRDSCDA